MLLLPDNPATSCLSSERGPDDTGGATTCLRGSTTSAPPSEPSSRVICAGAGAITLGAGSSSLAFTLLSCSGAETGGGTTFVLLTTGTRMLASSRWALLGAGGTMLESSWGVFRILSREICGAGGITGAFNRGTARI